MLACKRGTEMCVRDRHEGCVLRLAVIPLPSVPDVVLFMGARFVFELLHGRRNSVPSRQKQDILDDYYFSSLRSG